MEDARFVTALRNELVSRIGAERFELWLTSQARMSVEAGNLVVRAANSFVRDWLRRNLAGELASCAAVVAGRAVTLDFVVEPELDDRQSTVFNSASQSTAPSGRQPPADSRQPSPAPQSAIQKPKSIAERAAISSPDAPRRPAAPTLTQFTVGPSNQYAFRSAELTAQGLQQASPILFCGPTGVGKTHLLRAIQTENRRHRSRSLAVYLTAEQFTTSFVEALRGSGLPSFRQKCRGADLLLIDDLQFFVGKQRTIEELHHTIDTLVAAGRQLVFASDRNLAGLRGLGPELASRLAGGLFCEIAPPEFATRIAILRRLSGEMNLSVDDGVLALVATQITAGARELRGALHRLQAVSMAWQRPITRELAESAIADLVRQSTRSVRLADVEQAVCKVFHVEASTLRSDRKGRSQTEPRMLAMWLARNIRAPPGARSANSSAAAATARPSPPTAASKS